MSERATITGSLRLFAVAALVGGLAVGCTDSTFEDGSLPTDTVAFYLGYTVDSLRLTTCGNCHATFQASWSETGHADAWEDLQASGGAQAFCEACHTTNELGNPDTAAAGHNVVADARYRDVQCESCHGSGWEHVNSPAATQPLASIAADTGLTTGCGECHSGTHNPFVEQWSQSRHRNMNSYPQGRSDCVACHEGRAALEQKFFETSDYVEKLGTENVMIVCAVCHDPHGTEYEANLRANPALASRDQLCVRCHANRGTPPSTRGPHAAQGLLVLSEDVGWIPAGFVDPGPASHGSADVNPELCVTCHVAEFEVLDDQAEFLFRSVGHTFEAIPCLDADGLPTEGPCDNSERDYRACEACHGNNGQAVYEGHWAALNVLLDSLWLDVNADNVMDAFPTDSGLLPMVIALGDTTALDPRDDLITVPEGVLWNAQLAYTSDRSYWGGMTLWVGLAGSGQGGFSVSAHKTSGNGVHNPALLEELLDASIDALLDWLP